MAVEPEDDELLLDEPLDAEADDEPEGDGDQPDDEPEPQGDGEDDELEVTFGDEAAPASGVRDTDLVKHLRNEIRERDKRLAAAESGRVAQAADPGPRPTLADCDYDEELHEQRVDQWIDQRAKFDREKSRVTEAQRQAREEWERDFGAYQGARQSLRAADRDEAEGVALAALNETQQATIVQALGEKAAPLLYALGKHPAKLAEVSRISNPLKLAAAVAKLEGGLKVMPKRKVTAPESHVRGSAAVRPRAADKEEARLEAEAERTGDRTDLIKFRKDRKAKAA